MSGQIDDQHQLILMPSGRRGVARQGATVLEAARLLGVDLESICGGRQTCGKCLVTPEYGAFPKHNIISDADHLSPPTADELAYARKHGLDLSQQRLGCAACIQGDVLIHVPDSSLARKQVIRKAAGDRAIDVNPAVRLVYVEVLPPTLGERGDWQRLQDALAEQWDLHNLRIDPALLRTIQGALRAAGGAVTVTLWQGCEVIRIEPGYVESLYGVAVDIGSTTLAAHLCD
ncbi:MAG: ferredoxin, partial [Anaerolineae bacterium]|nr:ferredoxin [Anaerolineae bacterium]